VPRQYAKLAAQAGGSHGLNGFGQHATLRCNYFELELLRHNKQG
jgi:hypothetical protein